MNQLKSVEILARRWFQKSCGNTYHSCQVTVNGETLPKVQFAYGYGDQYLQTALSLLQSNGFFPKTEDRLSSGVSKDTNDWYEWMRNNREKLSVLCFDVTRKKDM